MDKSKYCASFKKDKEEIIIDFLALQKLFRGMYTWLETPIFGLKEIKSTELSHLGIVDSKTTKNKYFELMIYIVENKNKNSNREIHYLIRLDRKKVDVNLKIKYMEMDKQIEFNKNIEYTCSDFTETLFKELIKMQEI